MKQTNTNYLDLLNSYLCRKLRKMNQVKQQGGEEKKNKQKQQIRFFVVALFFFSRVFEPHNQIFLLRVH